MTASSKGPIVCFGEILLRLSAPDAGLLLQSPRLNANFGGAEANVAVSLSKLGEPARMVSILPDNAIGRAALEELRRYGVDVSGVRFAAGRMGLYFLTPGAALRSSEVLYDRAHSAFAEAIPDAFSWGDALHGATLLHLSGVTPALGDKASQGTLAAAKTARALGIPVSFDGNYRSKLWAAWSGDGPAILRELLGHASIAFVDGRDIALVLGQKFDAVDAAVRHRAAAKAAFAAFPHLTRIASTVRVQHSVGHNDLSGVLFTRDGGEFQSRVYALSGIVDRIGAGDAFAAGLLHGMRVGWTEQKALDFATAAAGLKHSIPGDFNLASATDVEAFLNQDGLDVRR